MHGTKTIVQSQRGELQQPRERLRPSLRRRMWHLLLHTAAGPHQGINIELRRRHHRQTQDQTRPELRLPSMHQETGHF